MSHTPERRHVVQAPVRALDADGAVVLGLGTVGFALAAVALWFRLPELDAAGRGWWWWVAVTGTALGVAGWLAARLRARRRARDSD